jgi:CheY-like chemotaxis protein
MEPKQGDRRETLRVLVVEENEARRDEIRSVLSAVTESELEVGETATLTSSSDADVAIVLLDGSTEGALRTIQRQSQNEFHPIMFAVVQDYSTGTMRGALSAGADEVLRWPLDPGDVTWHRSR